MTADAPLAALIGDVVGSRAEWDRRGDLHEQIAAAVDAVNERMSPVVPLRITVGDEYQGCFATVGDACRASLALRLALLPDHDVRHGIGWGATSVLSDEPRVEDGPAWWAAREAIEQAEAASGRAALRGSRTVYVCGQDAVGPQPEAINAALLCRDELVGSLSERSVMLLRGLLEGRTQRELAADLGVSASALSQRVRRDGLGTLVRADELLAQVS
ncbi:MAG TPA: SatD family protein [Nocardioides sp.]|nr:SatD family protein [Nocardioides sp.]